jgi:branched-chain amino acid transport system permease protein
MAALLQYLLTGLTLGSIYGLTALGFTMIWSATGIINFAQGEFVMLGGMLAVAGVRLGLSLPAAVVGAVVITTVVGMAVERFAIRPMRGRSVMELIIVTLGVAMVLRGVVMLVWGKDTHALAPFSGHAPLWLWGAAIMPQALWILSCSLAMVFALRIFFSSTLEGKAMQACACDPKAASLVGVSVPRMVCVSFALSALTGAVGGVLLAPLTMTSYDVGILLGLKGFASCILGGLGNPFGAAAGGIVLGVLESLAAGLISSAYKDAVALCVLLVVLCVRPWGLLGTRDVSRV